MTDSHGKFYWNELMARDVGKAKKILFRYFGLEL